MTARILLLACLAVSAEAVADISYNYVEAGYARVDVDIPDPGDNIKADSYAVFGSHEVYGPFYAFGGFRTNDFPDRIQSDEMALGVGAHYSLDRDSSVFLSAGYLRTDFDVAGFGFDADGYGATAGYRVENQSPWEFVATIDYINVETGVEFGGGIALTYDVARRFGIQGSFEYLDDTTAAFIGLRYFFDLNH